MPLFHIVSQGDWQAARRAGSYAPPSLAREGFIHLSADAQVAGTLQRFYAGVPGLVVLEVAEDLGEALVWEEGEPGVLFPHLYRALDPAEVVAVRSVDVWRAR